MEDQNGTTPEFVTEENSEDEIPKFNRRLVNHVCGIFPDACPTYIKSLCIDKSTNDADLDHIITEILQTKNNHPKRPPPSPPTPSSPQLKQYTTQFVAENFLRVIPDPTTFFSDPARKLNLKDQDYYYVRAFLQNKFKRLGVRHIRIIFENNDRNISETVEELEAAMKGNKLLKNERKLVQLPHNENIPLLQQLAYYDHKEEIHAHITQQKKKEAAERREARKKGLFRTCVCCFDEKVLPRDIYICERGCGVCKDCLLKSSEVNLGEGKVDCSCLMNCSATYTLQTLQAVLPPKLFSKFAQKKALEEIKAAGIEDLETCPFCDFATIPAEGYTIFTCLNPECMRESCRLCREPSHIPLRCEEVEKDDEVRARTLLENTMTQALLKKCYNCELRFFKEEGCNQMTCPCGAQMCYLCGRPVEDYKHFNGQGGERDDLCPLFSDSSLLNKENVLRGAEEAKAKMGNVRLKYDPTVDVDKHYEERRRMFPHLLPLVEQQLRQ